MLMNTNYYIKLDILTYQMYMQHNAKKNGQIIAIKTISMDAYPIDVMHFRKGNLIWISTSHENLVKYYGSFEVGSTLWILCEFMDGGSIRDIMKYAYKHGFKDETLIASILKPILEFLSSFHQDFQIHRSIGTSQILLGHDGSVKLSNLSFSSSLIEDGKRKEMRSSIAYGSSPKSTCYVAPEVLAGSGYSQKADVWSIGITAIELATGNLPYEDLNELEKTSSIISGPPPNLQNCSKKAATSQSAKNREFSPIFIDFIDKCLNKSPEKRPTAKALLEHKFFRTIYTNLNIPLNQMNTSAQTKLYIRRVLMTQLPSLKDRFESLHKFESQSDQDNSSKIADQNFHFRKAESSKKISEYLSEFFDSNSFQNGTTQSMDILPSLQTSTEAHQSSSLQNQSILLNSSDFIFDDLDEVIMPSSYGPSSTNQLIHIELIKNDSNNSNQTDDSNQKKKKRRSKVNKAKSTTTLSFHDTNTEMNANQTPPLSRFKFERISCPNTVVD